MIDRIDRKLLDLLQRGGPRPAAEVVIADVGGEPAGFALFFTSFSTFLGQPGLYLEDLFVLPQHRGLGLWRSDLRHARSDQQRIGHRGETLSLRGCGRSGDCREPV